MASDYRWVVVSLCIWLAGIDSIRGQSQSSDSSQDDQVINLNSFEGEDADVSLLRLEDLVRQEIETYFSLIQNDLNMPNFRGAYSYPGINPIAIQPRRLSRRDDTYRANVPRSCAERRAARREARRNKANQNQNQNQNTNPQGGDGYYIDGGQNPSYGYLPSGNQGQYINTGYEGGPGGMMWNSGGVPGQDFANQYFRGPGGRVGMRPPLQDSYNFIDNGGFGGPGNRMGMRPPPPDMYSWIGGPGNRMGPRPLPQDSYNFVDNGGQGQMSDSTGAPGSYVIQIPNRRNGRRNGPNQGSQVPASQSMNSEIPVDGPKTSVQLPARADGKPSGQNQIMRVSNGLPGSQSITSNLGNMETLIPEIQTNNVGVPTRKNGGQPSNQYFTVSDDGSSLETNNVGLPIRKNTGSSSTQYFPNADDGVAVETNNVGLPARRNGGQSSTQYFTVPDDGLTVETNNMGLPTRKNGGQSPTQYITMSDDGSSLEVPANIPNMGGSSNVVGGGSRTGQSRVMSVPSSNTFDMGNNGESTTIVQGGENGRRPGQSRIIVMPSSETYDLDNIGGSVTELPASGTTAGQSRITSLPSSQTMNVVGNGQSRVEQPGRNGQSRYILLPATDDFGLDDNEGTVVQLPTGGNRMNGGQSRVITLPSSQRNGGSAGTMSLPMDITSSSVPGSMMRTNSGPTGGDSARTQSESQPNYQIDIRNLGPESVNDDLEAGPTSTQTIVSNQPSEILNMADTGSSLKAPGANTVQNIVPSTNGVNKLVSSNDLYSGNEGTMSNPSKLMNLGKDGSKVGNRGPGGLLSAFRWGKSPKQSTIVQESNGMPSGSVTEVQPRVQEQIDTRSMETPGDMQANVKTQFEPTAESIKMMDNPREGISTAFTNTASPKRMGRPGSYYIIHHPGDSDEIPDMENFQELPFKEMMSGMKSQGGKYTSGIQGQQVAEDPKMGQTQSTSGTSRTSRSQGPMTMEENGEQISGMGGNGRAGRPRSYKVVVVNGDHDVLRNFKLPQPGSQFINSVDTNTSDE